MALVLNENLEWRQISITRPQDALAFRGTPVKTLVEPGRLLCRFITTESKTKGIPGNETFKSCWWMSWSATVTMLQQWKTKAAPKDIIRARMAVTEAFSKELDSLVQIILTKPAYAWKGIAQYQDDKARRVTYLGGGEQYYLPNLSSDRNGLSSNIAYLHCFTSIDSVA